MEKTQNPGPAPPLPTPPQPPPPTGPASPPPTGPARPDLLTQSRIQVVLKMGGKTRENEA